MNRCGILIFYFLFILFGAVYFENDALPKYVLGHMFLEQILSIYSSDRMFSEIFRDSFITEKFEPKIKAEQLSQIRYDHKTHRKCTNESFHSNTLTSYPHVFIAIGKARRCFIWVPKDFSRSYSGIHIASFEYRKLVWKVTETFWKTANAVCYYKSSNF